MCKTRSMSSLPSAAEGGTAAVAPSSTPRAFRLPNRLEVQLPVLRRLRRARVFHALRSPRQLDQYLPRRARTPQLRHVAQANRRNAQGARRPLRRARHDGRPHAAQAIPSSAFVSRTGLCQLATRRTNSSHYTRPFTGRGPMSAVLGVFSSDKRASCLGVGSPQRAPASGCFASFLA